MSGFCVLDVLYSGKVKRLTGVLKCEVIITEITEWLNRGWKLNREIEALAQTKLNLYLRVTRTTTPYERDIVGGTQDPHKMDKYTEYCQLADQKAAELSQVSSEILSGIYKISDTRYRTILIHRYLNFMTWESIARVTGYSWRHVMRLHTEALQAAQNVIVCHTD